MRIVNLRTLPYGLIINPDIKSRRSTSHIGKPDWIGQLNKHANGVRREIFIIYTYHFKGGS